MNYELIEINDRYILVPKTSHIKVHQMIELNYTASIIFKAVNKGMSLPLMTAFYMQTLGLSEWQALKDIQQTLHMFYEHNILNDDV